MPLLWYGSDGADMSGIEILPPVVIGLILYFMMVSKYRWISVIGYLLGILLVMVMCFHLGYQFRVCEPEPTKVYL